MRILAEEAPDLPRLSRTGDVGFLEASGERAACFGDPRMGFECWLWPIEIFRSLRVEFRRVGEARCVAPDDLALEATVVPGGFALHWRGAEIDVSLEVCAARTEPAVVLVWHSAGTLDVEVELVLRPIFRPMWPAGMGGQIAARDEETGALSLSEELGRFAALLGSLDETAFEVWEERGSDASDMRMRLALTVARAKESAPLVFVIAGASVQPRELSEAARAGGEQAACGNARARDVIAAARALWIRTTAEWPRVIAEQRAHWRAFLARTVRFTCSDEAHARAFEWSKIAIERAWTSVDGVGRSVVAGVGPSRGTARPGFAWFFGGDALAATRALCAAGDFGRSRELLRFVASTQRDDGKLMHELTLSARLCEWTRDYPYAYYKGQVTPGFVSCLAHHWRASGDDELVRELWPVVLRALRWCRSTLDESGRMSVPRAGIAAVEAGPLAGRIASEVFLEGIHLSALAGAIELARELALETGGLDLVAWERRTREAFEGFWSEELGRYGFARLGDGTLCDDLTGYLGLPLSRGVGEASRALATAQQLSAPELCADWGARMFSTRSRIYSAAHYNIGSVFPYLTNFVVLALYEHALLAPAEQLLESQVALCGFDGMGFVPEHLEGDRAQSPLRGVPHQVFSSGGILQSVVYGLFGIRAHAREGVLAVRSSLPAHWQYARLEGVHMGASRLDLELTRERRARSTVLQLRARLLEGPPLLLRWRPRLAPLSRLPEHANLGGERVALSARTLPSGACEAVLPDVTLGASSVLSLEAEEGPALCISGKSILPGMPSRQVRLGEVRVRERSSTWRLFGPTGEAVRVPFHSDRPVRIEGARLDGSDLVVTFPTPHRLDGDGFDSELVTIELLPT